MEIATVDLRGVVPGGAGWEAARAAVTASMVAHGCVLVVQDALGADLRRALFSRAVPALFALPLEVKQQMAWSAGRIRGYVSQLPTDMAAESLGMQPTDAASIRAFTEILWPPEGNPEFCEAMVPFGEKMMKLEEMVETLVLEGLGVRKESIGAHFNLLDYGVRMSHYDVPPDTESGMTLGAHYDNTMVTGIVQHEVEGVELLAGDGRWVSVPADSGGNLIAFVAGEQFRVATNGRVPACLHRVRTPSNRERFSMWFGRQQKEGVAVRPLEDLVDAEHPLAYNPLRHEEYFRWRYTEEGLKFGDPLKAYCGVEKQVVQATA